MNNITNYILEKLHLDKDTKIKIPTKENFIEVLKKFKDGINLSQVFGKNNLPCDNHNHDVDIEEILVKKDLNGYDEIYYSYFDPFDGFENVRVLNLNIFSNNQILKIYTYMQDHIK